MDIKQIYSLSKELNVLYVEDEFKVREQYRNFFTKFFNSVDIAEDGEEGLSKYIEYYEKYHRYYDIVISDISMPKINGIEMSGSILERNNEQQIVIVSAYNDSEKLQSLMDLGITFFIHKPMNFDNIKKVLNKVCSYIVVQKERKEQISHLENSITNLQNMFNSNNNIHEKDLFELYTLLENYELTSVVDKNGIIIEMNSKFSKNYKFDINYMIGKKFDIFRDDKSSAKIWDCIKNHNIFRGEVKNQMTDNTNKYFWTDLIVIPVIKDNKIESFKFIEEDITDEKYADDVLNDLINLDENVNLDI